MQKNELQKRTNSLEIIHPQTGIPLEEGNFLLNFQPINVGKGETFEQKYLVYLAPPTDPSPDGRFVQEEGGVVWYSSTYPEGEPCDTALISKAVGDRFLHPESQMASPNFLLPE